MLIYDLKIQYIFCMLLNFKKLRKNPNRIPLRYHNALMLILYRLSACNNVT
jgi:hypothetical protein